jgi:hypothetical protein
MEVNKSQETLFWEDIINSVNRCNRIAELKGRGKMIAGVSTIPALIKELKYKYYIDLMRHAKI